MQEDSRAIREIESWTWKDFEKVLIEILLGGEEMEKYYSLNETAEILGVKIRTLRKWLKDGFLMAHRYEGKKKWYVSQSEIDRLQNKMTEN